MTTVTESDIKELKDLIQAQTEKLNTIQTDVGKIEVILQNLNAVDKRLAVIEGRFEEWRPSIAKIPDLAEKVGELKNWKQVGLVFVTAVVSSIFSGTIGGVIGWLIRSGKA